MKIDSHQHAARTYRLLRALRPLLVAVVLFGAGAVSAQPRVVVSIPPYADLVQRLVAEDAVVDTLLPPGATPHAFDPTPRQLAGLEGADLVILNGDVDAWVLELVDALGHEVPVFVAMEASGVPAGDAHGHDDSDHDDEDDADEPEGERHEGDDPGHGAGGVNPHVWLDPVLVARIVPELAEALAAVDPAASEAYAAAADELVRELEALHLELAELLAPLAGAPFVPFHDAWPHFAARYGLDLILEIEPFPGREPSARALARAAEAVRATGARAIFNEAQLSDRPARVLAAEAGVAVATLDPLGGVPGRTRYEDLMRFNAEAIVDAFGDRRR